MHRALTYGVIAAASLVFTALAAADGGPAVGSSKDMEAEITPVPRAAAPGGAVKLLYTIYNFE
jgi:hypothetical protein